MSRFFSSGVTTGLGKVVGGQSLKLIKNEWTLVGRVGNFPLEQPRVVFVRKQGFSSQRAVRRPLYVLQRRSGEFIVADMNTLGRYEYRVNDGHVYMRRMLSAFA